jgi:hypothetical protein
MQSSQTNILISLKHFYILTKDLAVNPSCEIGKILIDHFLTGKPENKEAFIKALKTFLKNYKNLIQNNKKFDNIIKIIDQIAALSSIELAATQDNYRFIEIVEGFMAKIAGTDTNLFFRKIGEEKFFNSFLSCYLDLLLSDKPRIEIITDLEKVYNDLLAQWDNNQPYFFKNSNPEYSPIGYLFDKTNNINPDIISYIDQNTFWKLLDYNGLPRKMAIDELLKIKTIKPLNEKIEQMLGDFKKLINQFKIGESLLTLMMKASVKEQAPEHPSWQDSIQNKDEEEKKQTPYQS